MCVFATCTVSVLTLRVAMLAKSTVQASGWLARAARDMLVKCPGEPHDELIGQNSLFQIF